MYRASFRAEWLQRFGVGSCNCVGFGWANGGMGFGEVAQANGREEVTLAAGTVGASCRRSGPNPRIGGKAGLEGIPSLLSPVEEPQGSLCCQKGENVGVHKIEPSDSASCSLPFSPLTFFSFRF